MSELFAVPPIQKDADLSLNQERREVLQTVMEVLARDRPEPDELAACGYLLAQMSRHLSG